MFWVTGIFGLALIAAPFAFGYSTNPAALWSSVILGAIVTLVSGYKLLVNDRATWEDWAQIVAGVALLLMPFLFGFSVITAALWTCIIVGAALILLPSYDLYLRADQA
ncbi:MAG: SPW repeat protein [Chloroflexaceae bacterium]|jgi:hypothetical protein|nr:SPW repeat protein [Chloroflexaceae bacterium]